MKPILPLALAAVLLAGCNAGRSAMSGAEQVRAGLGDAVTAPLDDFNLRRQLIPTVLLQAEANPYDLRNLNQCSTIGADAAGVSEGDWHAEELRPAGGAELVPAEAVGAAWPFDPRSTGSNVCRQAAVCRCDRL